MALALMLRGSSAVSAYPQLLKSFNKIISRQNYSQLLGQSTKNVVVYAKNKNLTILKRHMSGDHSKLWPIEKLVSIALLGVVPATFFWPNLILDDIFSVLVVTHFHWGLEACVVDYIRPIIFGPIIPKITLASLYLLSIATLGGLLYYNHHCIGVGCTFRRIWEIQN